MAEEELKKDMEEGLALLGGGKDGKPVDEKARMAYVMKMGKLLFSCCLPFIQGKPAGGSRPPSAAKDAKPATTEPPAGEEPAKAVKSKGRKLGVLKSPDAEIAEIFEPVREQILEKVVELIGKDPGKLEVMAYRTQIVIGSNYFTKVKLGDGPSTIHAKIYSPVEGEPLLQGISDIKNPAQEIEYF